MVNIREIRQDDYENLTALATLVWLSTYAKEGVRGKFSRFVLTEFTPGKFENLHQGANTRVFVAVNDQYLIGFITLELKELYQGSDRYGYKIEKLYVHNQFQRQGVGRLLLNWVHKHIGQKSWLSTWIHNTPAISFYTQNGFTLVGMTEFDLLGEKHKNYVFSTGLDENEG